MDSLPIHAHSLSGTPSQRFRAGLPTASLPHLQRLSTKLTDIRNTDPSTRQTSLQLAVLYGRQDVVEWLVLDEGHEEGEISRDTLGETCCHIAAALGHIGILELYVSQYPFVLDWVNSRGATPLHLAAQKGQFEAAQFLIEMESDIDAPDLQGNTPLHYASSYDKIEVAKLLIDSGCQFGMRNNEGFTASDYSYSFACQRSLDDYITSHLALHKKKSKSSRKTSPHIQRASSLSRNQLGIDTSPSSLSQDTTPQPQTPDEITPTKNHLGLSTGTGGDGGAYGLGFAYSPGSPTTSIAGSVPLSPSNSQGVPGSSGGGTGGGNGGLMTPPTSGRFRSKPSSPSSPLSNRNQGSANDLGDSLGSGTGTGAVEGLGMGRSTSMRSQVSQVSQISSAGTGEEAPGLPLEGLKAFQSLINTNGAGGKPEMERSGSSHSALGRRGLGSRSSSFSTAANPNVTTGSGVVGAGPGSVRSRSTSTTDQHSPHQLHPSQIVSSQARSRAGSASASRAPPPPLFIPTASSNLGEQVPGSASGAVSPSIAMSKNVSSTGSTSEKDKEKKDDGRGRSASNESTVSGGRVARALGLGKRS